MIVFFNDPWFTRNKGAAGIEIFYGGKGQWLRSWLPPLILPPEQPHAGPTDQQGDDQKGGQQ